MLNHDRMDGVTEGFGHTAPARTEPARGTARKHFVLDTNVLLHNAQSIFKFAEHEVVVPLAVIEELDTFKKNNDDRGRNARQVTRALDRLRAQGALFEGVVWNEQGGSIRVARCGAHADFSLVLDQADTRSRLTGNQEGSSTISGGTAGQSAYDICPRVASAIRVKLLTAHGPPAAAIAVRARSIGSDSGVWPQILSAR